MIRALASLLLLASLPGQQRIELHDGWEFAPAAPDPDVPPPDGWRAVHLPATFESILGPEFDGVGWYRRRLDVGRFPADARLRLELHGAATETSVRFAGREVGRHLGAWTPFRVELPRPAEGDAPWLELRVDEKVGHDTQGFLPILQPHFGGIWREVILSVDRAPALDRFSLLTFGARDRLRIAAQVLPGPESLATELRVRLRDGARLLLDESRRIDRSLDFELPVDGIRLWSPAAPNLYPLSVELLDPRGRVVDRVERRVGFREVAADGRRLRWNGDPLQVRGMLHWGYEPPALAPNVAPEIWRRELEGLRARGFNLVKACLWVPPRAFYEIADELGLLVWQEYPTWHPRFTPERREALATEFDEFFRYDRSHPSVAFRSLTCETGHGADLGVITELYERAKAAVPNTLVVDDSSWISWNRVHDFWDDHPYGNNRGWPAKLASFDAHLRRHGEKPLLLGECITGDTWIDLAAWQAVHGRTRPWWMPKSLPAQPEFEAWLAHEHGPDAVANLLPDSLAYTMRNRKYQIERLRCDLPEAGYVVSVLRDVTLARMGMIDPVGAWKWPEHAWDWHRATMLALDVADDRRAFVGAPAEFRVAVAHGGARALRGTLEVAAEGWRESRVIAAEPGQTTRGEPFRPELAAADRPRRVRVTAELRGDPPARSQWDLWLLPPPPELPPDVAIVDALDVALLDRLARGGRAILLAGERRNSLKTRAHAYYRGAPIAPAHAIHAALPRDLLLELQTFDLEGGRVIDWDPWRGQIDPILALWDTHDLAETRSFLLAGATRVGEGRLAVTSLDQESPAGRYALAALAHHLDSGPPPARALRADTLATLRADLARETLDLTAWEIRFDPEDRGLAEGWARGDGADGWSPIRAGAHWEAQGFPHRDGVAWYRCRIELPASWRGKNVHALFEGVDDSYECFVDGVSAGRHGDPERDVTIWLQRTVVDLTRHVRPGETQWLVLRVVDHRGSGGLWKPASLTTGSPDAGERVH